MICPECGEPATAHADDCQRLPEGGRFDMSPIITDAKPTEPTVAQPTEHVMQFFEYAHLPDSLQRISAPFWELAQKLLLTVPRNPERTKALNKLLEAKDCAVRAFIAKPVSP